MLSPSMKRWTRGRRSTATWRHRLPQNRLTRTIWSPIPVANARRVLGGSPQTNRQGRQAGVLRTQLKMVHDAASVVDEPLGHVIGGDYIFHVESAAMLQPGCFSRKSTNSSGGWMTAPTTVGSSRRPHRSFWRSHNCLRGLCRCWPAPDCGVYC